MTNQRVPVLGIRIDPLTTSGLRRQLRLWLSGSTAHQIVTVNPEFILAAAADNDFRKVLEQSDINTADGTGVLWAAEFFRRPTVGIAGLRWFHAAGQAILTLSFSLFSPAAIRKRLPEKISGSEFVWDIVEECQSSGARVFLLGGYGDVPKIVAEKMRARYPKLLIAGTHAGSPDEHGIVERVNQSGADVLLVAFGPVRQEKWIAGNLQNLRVKLAIGLGGTFDYIAGKKPLAPRFLRQIGLEWAFRLVTQPYRLKRVWNAVPRFIFECVRYRVQMTKPLRPNVIMVVRNERDEVLVCRGKAPYENRFGEHWQLPQGGIDNGESPEQARARELGEELSINDYVIEKFIPNSHWYFWPPPICYSLYDGRYSGQMQSFFVVRINTEKQKIIVDQVEFDAYRWVAAENLDLEVHPIRRASAKIAQSAMGIDDGGKQ